MLEILKKKIWNLLKEKQVSLAMIYDLSGNILWKRGREIKGRNVHSGSGFSQTSIRNAFHKGNIFKTGELVSGITVNRSAGETAFLLNIKSLIINRINREYFLYIDSGARSAFTALDRERFNVIGTILGDTLLVIESNEMDSQGISGTSAAVKNIRKQITTYSMMDEPVLLTGETGTGKTHIARLLHHYSGKKGKFKTIHTPGIPENLFESEMFGHTKGAFTGAVAHKKGLVEEAAGGTLFIDEITEVSTALQAKLLRFIETGYFTRLGESAERNVDVRIVAATNKEMAAAIQNKEFREDLYYRLNVFEIHIPPLRERKEDIRELVAAKQKYISGKKPGNGFWESLHNHDWPGNIRELNSVLKRAGIHGGDTLTGTDINGFIRLTPLNKPGKPGEDSNAVNRCWTELMAGKSFWDVVKKPFLSRDLKRSEVRAIIARGLADTRGRYKHLVERLNLAPGDYHRFMRFIHEQKLQP